VIECEELHRAVWFGHIWVGSVALLGYQLPLFDFIQLILAWLIVINAIKNDRVDESS